MACRILNVLLWKHAKVRMRKWYLMIPEYFSTMLFFLLIFFLKTQFIPKSRFSEHTMIQRPEALPLSLAPTPRCIFYTPHNEFTEKIMDSVGRKLNMGKLEYLSGNKWDSGYYPFQNFSEIANYTSSKKMGSDNAIVIFENPVSDALPDSIKYTIRMKTPFLTQVEGSLDDKLVPHERYGTIYEPFMRLQWAIDTSFIELLTGSEVEQTVTLQEFPYAGNPNYDYVDTGVALLSAAMWCGLFLPFMLFIGRLVRERVSGVQDLMRMSGVSTWTLTFVHFLDVLPAILIFSITGAVLMTIGDHKLLSYSNGFLLFVVFFLHACSVIAMAFVFSYVIRSLGHASTLAAIVYLVITQPSTFLIIYLPASLNFLIGIVPFVPKDWFIKELAVLEKYGIGLTFSSMMKSHDPKSPSVFVCLMFLVIQIVVMTLLVWYLDHTMPGKYGHAHPWNFFCNRHFWRKSDVAPGIETDDELERPMVPNQEYIEPAPAHVKVGIRAQNITKVFPKHRALNDVSVDVYNGELTVLLGHNGAGKTTLMSIMTGTLRPTSGTVYVNGQDISKNTDVRRQIGFCPQHNMYYPELNVIEHAVLFSTIRGQTRDEAWQSSRQLLQQLGLQDKARVLGGTLSGGMKRRLQLACALAGDANVLVLDEPSSGLDVETRRNLWNLVLALRGNRTVLISTHFMEEADALGDRVVALHNGVVRAHATPMYLKKAIGTGYRLTFTTVGKPNEAAITEVVRYSVPEATVKEVALNSISLSLPATSSGAFPALFATLEAKKTRLGIESIGVGVSTLEEVFLQLCSDIDTSSLSPDEVDGVSGVEPSYKKTVGARLCYRHFWELIKRQAYYILHNKYIFIIAQLLLPLLVIVLMGVTFVNPRNVAKNATARAMSVDAYDPTGQYRVLYDAPDAYDSVQELSKQYPDVRFDKAPDIAEVVLRTGQKNLIDYNKYLAGIELNKTHAKVLFTTTVRHAAPSALNLLANVLAHRARASSTPAVLAVNFPLESDQPRTQIPFHSPKSEEWRAMFTLGIALLFLFTLMSCSSLPVIERQSGARHIHIMAGCSPELYWFTSLMFRMAVTAVAFILPTIIVCATDRDRTFNEPYFLVAWAVLLTLGTLAFVAFAYLITFMLSLGTTQAILILVVLFSLVSGLLMVTIMNPVVEIIVYTMYALMPSHALIYGLYQSSVFASLNAMCNLNRAHCAVAVFDDTCCGSDSNPYCFFCFENDGPGEPMLVLLAQFIVYMSLVLMTQRGMFSYFCHRMRASGYRQPVLHYDDEMVKAEKAYVAQTIKSKNIPDSMLVHDICKRFPGGCRSKPFHAVKGISFSVKKGECLGLLGVNGAGKTTTFRILTGEDWPTRGSAYAAGKHRQGFSTNYMRGLGYCPQFFGLDDFLTGRQNLKLILTLKGLNKEDVDTEMTSWIKIVGLEKYVNRKVCGYSGGCQRRLAAAASLSCGSPITLLDEPTSGVDVSARRRVWAALRRGLAHNRAVIITSHSMDEMEALCHRIALMSGGELCALGSPAGLRAAHANGHAVVLKITPTGPGSSRSPHTMDFDETDATRLPINQLKGTIQQKFNCTLKDEHMTMLHYHINETMSYSKLFEEMERLKQQFPNFIEDYSVTETTLEEVFLSFAKQAEEFAALEAHGRPGGSVEAPTRKGKLSKPKPV